MLIQILLGALLLMLTTILAAASALMMLRFARRHADWLTSEPHERRLMVAAAFASLWMLMVITLSVTIWATAFRLVGLFPNMEVAVYFSLVTYTTLGYGDVTPSPDWRLLAATSSVGGLLNVALLTAVMIETLRNIRLAQMRHEARAKRGKT